LAILLSLVVPVVVAAQTTYTWTGAASGEWGNADNWSPHGVPGATENGTDIVTFGPSARTSITVVNAAGAFDIGTLKFLANAPAYSFALSGTDFDFYVEDGIVNLSTTIRPSFTVPTHDCLCIYAGDLANSRISNTGEVLADGSATAGSAYIVNESGGTVRIEGSDSSAATLVNRAGGYVDVANKNWDFGSLSGGGSVNMGPNAVTVGFLDGDDIIAGNMDSDNGGSLTKTGNGTLTLSGANTYTGLTIVESGALQVDGALNPSGSVDLEGGGLSLHPATLKGGGSVGDVWMDADTRMWPGNDAPDSKLTMNTLGCNGTGDYIYERIGNVGSATHGTYLHLKYGLQAGNCPFLRFWLLDAGVPLAAGQSYLIAVMDGATSFTTSNLGYAMAVPGYPQAHGHFFVFSSASFSDIFFILDDVGDGIFQDGFED
jgi:autotransporter-associated beta strand protein